MTNSNLMIDINTLKSEIQNQTHLCDNIFKLDDTKKDDINDLLESTISKIEIFKYYQKVLNIRNFIEIITYNEKEMTVSTLIKIKETLLLKKNLKNSLIHTSPAHKDLIEISLKAFQDVQEYKKQLSVIHIVLEKFNNEQFEIKDYE